ncbi:F-box domain protein [Pandoravirus inopinatum]|uniref:F-box domain protein n=1 Tax=Pandoravirus inopinatum TaxID=1605721 RepID=A0A0B5J8L7_9VIRU|nr:F-box domain protein [Pandoravirus inopinatum]AJF98270.1 F-box domain protein [Pandoravirus inopinatum]
MLCGYVGRVKFTPALQAVLDPAVTQWARDNIAWPWFAVSNQDSDRLSDALAARVLGLSARALADLLLDLQREGHVAWVHTGITGFVGLRGSTGLVGPQGLMGLSGIRGPAGCAGV